MNTSRNIYRHEVDFAVLALKDAAFSKHLRNNGQVNFSDPEVVKDLTKALLKRDFQLTVDLPDNRLCPPVPNRLNYILWLQDLIDQTPNSFSDAYNPERNVTGLDIGVGASAIYPLLATRLRPSWRMLGSDIDAQNLVFATRNVAANEAVSARIRLLPQRSASADTPLIPLDEFNVAAIDFVMTNPPFYGSQAELLAAAKAKARPPHSACTGADVEMVYEDGGEVGFVRRMVRESVPLRTRVGWYTCMLGKAGSVPEVVSLVRDAGCRNWCVTEFVQGNKTRRWAVAWSWRGYRPAAETARAAGAAVEKALLPFPSEVTFPVPAGAAGMDGVAARVCGRMDTLDLRWDWAEEKMAGLGVAKGNVWSRAARRKKIHEEEQTAVGGSSADMDEDEDDEEPALAVRIGVKNGKEDLIEVDVRWLVGQDHVLFESFCGMLRRHLVA